MYPDVAEKFRHALFKVFGFVYNKVSKTSHLTNKAYSCDVEKFVYA